MSINWTIDSHDSLPTTQDVALKALREGAAEGYVVHTYEQPDGRGRFGNVWLGARGNVYMSIVLRPETSQTIGDYAFVMAAAAAHAFADKVKPHALQLKWPNDVLVDGRKMAGILIEAQWQGQECAGLVAGIGLNVDAPPPERVGLNAMLPHKLSVDAARDAYLAGLAVMLEMYRQQGFSAIRTEWLRHAWGIGQPIRIRLADRTQEGIFTGLTDDGALLLNTNGHIASITSGEIIMDAATPVAP